MGQPARKPKPKVIQCPGCKTKISPAVERCNDCWGYEDFDEEDWLECSLCLDAMEAGRKANYCLSCEADLKPVTKKQIETALVELRQWIS